MCGQFSKEQLCQISRNFWCNKSISIQHRYTSSLYIYILIDYAHKKQMKLQRKRLTIVEWYCLFSSNVVLLCQLEGDMFFLKVIAVKVTLI